MSDRYKPAAISRGLHDWTPPHRSDLASFPEVSVVAWEKQHHLGAAFCRYCRLYLPFFCVTFGAALFNLLVPWLGEAFPVFGGNMGFILVVAMMAGAMVGQVAWLSIWAAFGPGPYKLRWAASMLAVESLYLSLFWALGETNGGADRADFSILAVLPLALISMQAPLWAWRFASGRRLCVAYDGIDLQPPRRQFRLLDILGVTTSICVAAAPASLWLQWTTKTRGTAASLLTICLSASLIGVIAASIFVWAAAATRRSMFFGSILIVAVIATALVTFWSTGSAAPVNSRYMGSSLGYLNRVITQSSFNVRFAMFWFLPCAAFVLVFHAGALTLRAFGYRLRRLPSGIAAQAPTRQCA